MIVRTAEEAEYEDILNMTQEAFRRASDERSTGEFESNIVKVTTTNDPNFRYGDLRVVEARALFSKKPLSLTIQTEGEAITLRLNKARVTVSTGEEKADFTLKTPLSALNQLLTGYKDIHRLLDEKAVRIDNIRANEEGSSAIIELVNALFPKSTPYDYHLPIVWE